MVNRTVVKMLCQALLLAGVGVSQPLALHAFSFGAPELRSHLGEPLDVKIPFSLQEGESLNQLFISLAKAESYAQWGLQPYVNLADLHVAMNHEKGDVLYVEVSSQQPMHLPVASFLLSATEGRHRYYKQIQLILDPIPALQGGKGTKKRMYHTSSVVTHASAQKEPESEAVGRTDWARLWRYGPVRVGDSLSTIAYRLRRDKRWSNHEVMLGLYRLNEEAFVDANMNQLKTGVWLDVPREKQLKVLLSQKPSQAELDSLQPVKKQDRLAEQASDVGYVGHIVMNGLAAKSVVKLTPEEVREELNKRLDDAYAKNMDSHIRMDSLNQAVVKLTHDVTRVDQGLIALKEDQMRVQAQVQSLSEQKEGVWPWRLGLLALFFLNALGLGFLYRYSLARKVEQPVESEAVSQAEKIVKVKPVTHHKGKVLHSSIDNQVYDIERSLDSRDYEMAEEIFSELSEEQRKNVRISALQTRYFHETQRVDDRDDYVRQIRQHLNETQWRVFCDRLPLNIWKSLTVAGVIEGASYNEDSPEHESHDFDQTVMLPSLEVANPILDMGASDMDDLGFDGIPKMAQERASEKLDDTDFDFSHEAVNVSSSSELEQPIVQSVSPDEDAEDLSGYFFEESDRPAASENEGYLTFDTSDLNLPDISFSSHESREELIQDESQLSGLYWTFDDETTESEQLLEFDTLHDHELGFEAVSLPQDEPLEGEKKSAPESSGKRDDRDYLTLEP